jgi:hypothetical protein
VTLTSLSAPYVSPLPHLSIENPESIENSGDYLARP